MSTENLQPEAAVKKLKKLVEDIRIAMMITGFEKTPLDMVPMATKKVDENQHIWFLSGRSSQHNQDLEKSDKIQLVYSDPSDMAFLSIYGKAEIVTDKHVIKELYSSRTDNWFSGADDPEITAIKVKPEEAYYWDTKSNKYVSLAKMGIGALTGKHQDIGEKGHLDL